MKKPSRKHWLRAAWAGAAAAAVLAAVGGVAVASGGTSGVITVTCADTTADASTLQGDINNSATSGTWYGITATSQGAVGSVISDNKVFNLQGEESGSNYVYIAVPQVNYGTGYLSVTGNVIVGDQTSDTGFSFSGGGNKLVIASSGNEVSGVGTTRTDASSVTLSSGI